MKPMIGYEGIYSVLEDGRVFSHKTNLFLKPQKHWGMPYFRYAVRKDNKTRYVHVHRLIGTHYMGAGPNDDVDHINRNGGDNRLCNLRVVTHQQNIFNSSMRSNNTSGFIGVSYKRYGRLKWGAKLRKNWVGNFATKEEAARAYDSAASEAYGEFAVTNKSLGLLP